MTRITIFKLIMIMCCIKNISSCAEYIEAGNDFGVGVTLTLFFICLFSFFYLPRR